MLAIEYEGDSPVRTWHSSAEAASAPEIRSHRQNHQDRILRNLVAAFLPHGYPTSVTSDYLAFQIWDSIQALCSYVRGMLTSQALLQGVGMGKEAATPTAAVFQFLMRDLSGMLGGTIFAFFQGSDLDSHAKQWRLFADCFNNVGYALELASPHFPQAFLVLACLGSIARAITGVAGGATRAALTQHFAAAGNAADVSAKEGSQETATTLVGMLLGMTFLHFAEATQTIWAAFLLLTALHIYANVRAVRSLCLSSLNAPRLQILLTHALEAQGVSVLSPAEVAAREGLAPPPLQTLYQRVMGGQGSSLNFGLPLHTLGKHGSLRDVAALCNRHADQRYLLQAHGRKNHAAVPGLSVVLRRDADRRDELQAFAHGWVLLHFLQSEQGRSLVADDDAASLASAWVHKQWPQFLTALAGSGWNLERVALGRGSYSAAWGSALKEA
ncbi:hypothetical protein WJX73_006543 [Symbiochloris irregularis]|uniref:Uncharacterized protein n=1 Tax=Symbiochloris irregularis TaxID=706552 RepID=A0AAW1P1T9_9CHLO